MRAVKSGNRYGIYDNTVQLYNGLPAQAYRVEFSPREGFSLSGYGGFEVGEKVYGVHETKVSKVLASFESFRRSLGVILSGDKGIGKSLFAKLLCIKAIEAGYPVVICDTYYPGIAQFLDDIDQTVVVLFDEFDKTFHDKDDKEGAQASMLSLFDGVSSNKKLFCVTCNNLRGLNDYLVNRPGRFHYHFRFEYPGKEDIEVYMKDHIAPEKWGEIPKIVDFSKKVDLNYDCLRAIAFELSLCDTFESAISDLNILRPDNGVSTTLYLCFSDGTRMKAVRSIDSFSENDEYCWFGDHEVDENYLKVEFVPADAVWSHEDGGFYLPVTSLTVTEDSSELDGDSWLMEHHKEYVLAHRAKNVTGLMMRRNMSMKSIHYFSKV